jgi:hypothetical protein
LYHRHGRVEAFADDLADGDRNATVVEQKRIVPIAADGRLAAPGRYPGATSEFFGDLDEERAA